MKNMKICMMIDLLKIMLKRLTTAEIKIGNEKFNV